MTKANRISIKERAERLEKDMAQINADVHRIEAELQAYCVALEMVVNDMANGVSVGEATAKHGIRIPRPTLHRAAQLEDKSEVGQPADDEWEIPPYSRKWLV